MIKYLELPNIFVIADGILLVVYNDEGRDLDNTLRRVLQICREVTLRLNRGKCHFRYSSAHFFVEIIYRHGMKPDPQEVKAFMKMHPPTTKK